MSDKQFAERLNRELDAIGLPPHNDERVVAFAKLLKIPRFKAESLLNGITRPDENLAAHLAEELEVNPDWLLGKSEQRHNKKRGKK